MSRVLINAANLRTGGALQVAASFLDELVALQADAGAVGSHPWLADGLEVAASPQVLANCAPTTLSKLPHTVRSATLDLRAPARGRYDVSFTIFGPEYVPINARHRIVGFADGTSLHPEFLPRATGAARLRQIARLTASRASFHTTGHVVVEAPHVARDLERRWGIPSKRISVIPNSYNAIFDQPDSWEPVTWPAAKNGTADVCYVTRATPHKNMDILGRVGDIMLERGTPVRFVLTLTDAEWEGLAASTRRHSVTLGAVSVQQLPNVYAACDASIFPSLLESSSVMPLEAMVTRTPLVASDRDFVRDVCGDVPWYADPDDAESFSRALKAALTESDERQRRLDRGCAAAGNIPSARERAEAYVQLIDSSLS